MGTVRKSSGITCSVFLFDFLISFRDFAELSFFLVPPGITFCALSFLFVDTCQQKMVSQRGEKKLMTDEC